MYNWLRALNLIKKPFKPDGRKTKILNKLVICHHCTCFTLEKGRITSLFSRNIKHISEKLKKIQCCRFAILEIQNSPEK